MARKKVVDPEKRSQILRLRGEGKSVRVIATEVGVSTGTVSAVINSPTPELDDIDDIDHRLQEIKEEESRLKAETEALQKQRYDKFVSVDGTVTYDLDMENYFNECRIFINIDGRKQLLYEGSLYNESPRSYDMTDVPEKYKNEFVTVWHRARAEKKSLEKKKQEQMEHDTQEYNKSLNELLGVLSLSKMPENNKNKIIRTLLKVFHPDALGQKVTITNDDPDIIKDILQLKNAWGV